MRISRRVALIALAATVGVAVVVQIVTYLLWAEAAMPVVGVRHLTDYAHVRKKRSGWSFACVTRESWDSLTDAQRRALDNELSGAVPKVYHCLGDVPDDMKHFEKVDEDDIEQYESWKKRGGVSPRILETRRREIEAGRRIIGFRRGAKISWTLRRRGLFWMRCASSNWMSMTGAQWREDIFIWVLGFWMKLYTCHAAVA